MNNDSQGLNAEKDRLDGRPILLVPYMWIGDFVRCHTVVKLLKQRFPSRAIDVLTTSMVAPLLDYMPGVRRGVVELRRMGEVRRLEVEFSLEGEEELDGR